MATATAKKSTARKPAAAKATSAKKAGAAKADAPNMDYSKNGLTVKVGRKHTHVLDASGAYVAWLPTVGAAKILATGGKPGRVRVNFGGGAWVAAGRVDDVRKALA